MSGPAKKPRERRITISEADLARAVASSYLVAPAPNTQGDVEHFWETRSESDRKTYERRAAQIFRVLTLPRGETTHYTPRVRPIEG